MPLYDYLYVDLPKVISLYSQITGGVVETLETTQEQARSSDNKRAYDFKVFRHDAGGTDTDACRGLPSSADSRVGCRVLVARRWHADSLQALFITTQIATVLIPIGQHPAPARFFINPVMMHRRPMGMAVDQARIAVFA